MIGVDIPIQQLTTLFTNNLWTSYNCDFNGRIYDNEKKDKGINPELFISGKQYREKLLDTKQDATVFFRITGTDLETQIADVEIYFSVNLATLYPSIAYRADEHAIQDAKKWIDFSAFELQNVIRGREAFSDYFAAEQTKHDMQPYCLFRFDTTVFFNSFTCEEAGTINYSLVLSSNTGGSTVPADGTYSFVKGATTAAYALVESGYRFVKWVQDGVSKLTNPIALIMNSDINLVAQFIKQWTLTISASGDGTVTPESGLYDEGTQILTAIPTDSEVTEFDYWDIDGDTQADNPYTLTVDSDKTIVGYFTPILKTYYVRPSGGSYGSEDGSSYDNAWDGFSNVAWHIINPGDTIYVCGMHTELLNIGASGDVNNQLIIRFDAIEEAGSINGLDTIFVCLDTNDKSYLTITADIANKTLYDAVVSCANNADTGTGIVYNGIWADGSGNQAFQHLGDVSVTYIGCKGSGCVDDGISIHDATTVVATNCTFSGNLQGVNGVGTASITLNNCIIENNTQYGIWTTASMQLTANGCTIENNAQDLRLTQNSNSFFNNCTINSLTSDIFLGGSILDIPPTADFIGCRIRGNINCDKGSLILKYNHITNDVRTNVHTVSCTNSGATVVNNVITYNVIENYNTINAKSVLALTGTSDNIIYNNTLIGADKTQNGVVATDNSNNIIKNNIITGFAIGAFDLTSGTFDESNNLYFNNTSNANAFTPTNPIYTNPNISNIANDEFWVVAPSDAIGNALDLGATYDDIMKSTTVFPTSIITQPQSVNWDIGAMIE